jgi:hypothetical protein
MLGKTVYLPDIVQHHHVLAAGGGVLPIFGRPFEKRVMALHVPVETGLQADTVRAGLGLSKTVGGPSRVAVGRHVSQLSSGDGIEDRGIVL